MFGSGDVRALVLAMSKGFDLLARGVVVAATGHGGGFLDGIKSAVMVALSCLPIQDIE
jgi:hypothetical protein